MTLKNQVELFEEDSKILESLAREHGESSREYAALKRAAIALWYVLAEDHHKFRLYEKTDVDMWKTLQQYWGGERRESLHQ